VVDIEQIKRNALEGGIPLSQIAVVYKTLNDSEKEIMRQLNLITRESENVVIARFTDGGDVCFREKVDSVLCLSA
jgi:hypothetical protein